MSSRNILLTILLCVFGAGFGAPESLAETITFQQRTYQEALGYVGTQDTYLWDGRPSDVDNGTASGVAISDGDNPLGGIAHGMLRFDQIFGLGGIPDLATITAAELTLWTNTTNIHGSMHRVLFDWSEATLTWNGVGANGIQANGIEAASTPTVTFSTQTPGPNIVHIDVTNDLQLWASGGQANYGWAFLPEPGANSYWSFYSSEDQNSFNDHPLLSVEYSVSTVPEPSSGGLFAIACGTILGRRVRRQNIG